MINFDFIHRKMILHMGFMAVHLMASIVVAQKTNILLITEGPSPVRDKAHKYSIIPYVQLTFGWMTWYPNIHF